LLRVLKCDNYRHQLKPILDAAKSLQIKGIGDADPTEILSQQALPSSSASAAAAVLASRFKQVNFIFLTYFLNSQI
jgi:hypothetical protein